MRTINQIDKDIQKLHSDYKKHKISEQEYQNKFSKLLKEREKLNVK